MPNSRAISVIPLAVVMLALLLWVATRKADKLVRENLTPDFREIIDVKTKKQAFFAQLLPLVQQSNKDIRQERAVFIEVSNRLKHQWPLTEEQAETIFLLAKKYRVTVEDPPSASTMTLLDLRIDTIPAVLALAQAANESAWGTSRFVIKENNYFSFWHWSSNCGLVPDERSKGKYHEVSRFNALVDGVKYYMQTLNSHPAYRKLKGLRFAACANNTAITGMLLAGGLLAYSERGATYIEELRTIIRLNNLVQFDQTNLDLTA